MSCNCTRSESHEVDYQYSAKLICGSFKDKHLFTPGTYRTVVNIHNPSRCDKATFVWKVALANHVDSTQAKISKYFEWSLEPDGTCYIDCEYAIKKAGLPVGTNFDGWLVIESESEFDVEVVHTVQPATNVGASSISTERIRAREIPKCLSAQLDLSTGIAAWQVVARDGSTHPAAMVDLRTYTIPGLNIQIGPDPINQWAVNSGWKDLPGTYWIYDFSDREFKEEKEFRLNFDLKFCGSYQQTDQTLEVVCDNYAYVELNGVPLTGGNGAPSPYQVTGPSAGSSTLTIPAGAFVDGTNTLTVKIKNLGGNAGFALLFTPLFLSAFCQPPVAPGLPCPEIEFDTWCNKHIQKNEHWSSNGGAWYSGSPSLQNCPNALFTLDAIKSFRVRIKNTAAMPWVHVKYECRVEKKIGSANQHVGPFYDGQDCGKISNNWAVNWIRVGLVNAPRHCGVHYKVERSVWPNPDDQASNYGQAGWSGWSIHSMAIWT